MLESGTYQIGNTVEFEDNVILRGVDRESVVIKPTLRASSNNKKSVFLFQDDSYSGIEDLTIDYSVEGLDPIAPEGLRVEGGFSREAFEDNPDGRNDLYVRQIDIRRGSDNNLIDNVAVINSGTSPIRVAGNNNTLRNNLIDGSYNKGGGNGYYAINGDNNLIQNETVREIRHFAVQRGAKNNVIVDSEFYAANIDFHNADGGNNLVENNRITIPNWFSGDPFDTGGPRLHQPPGQNNILFNNEVQDFSYGSDPNPFSDDNIVYTYEGFGVPVATDLPVPDGCNYK